MQPTTDPGAYRAPRLVVALLVFASLAALYGAGSVGAAVALLQAGVQ
jgi:hypothetical protein